jgi:hypothetical protein
MFQQFGNFSLQTRKYAVLKGEYKVRPYETQTRHLRKRSKTFRTIDVLDLQKQSKLENKTALL